MITKDYQKLFIIMDIKKYLLKLTEPLTHLKLLLILLFLEVDHKKGL